MIAAIMWLIPLAGLLIWLPFELVHEIRATGTPVAIGGDQSERVFNALMAGLVPATVIALLARAAYRGRIVGPAVIGTVLAIAATAIHLVLLLKLLQGTGGEEVSVAVGPWLVATGLATMAAAGWMLTGDAARWRRHAMAAVPSGETPNA